MALPEAEGLAHRLCVAPNVTENSKSPIDGYENAPLVNFETAVEPLKGIVPEVENMLLVVKDKCVSKKTYLSVDEHCAICLYTQPWSPEEISFYRYLNKALRDDDSGRLKCFFPYLQLFVTALSKVPIERRHVYRGVKQDIAEEYQKDRFYYWSSFNSCTTSVDVLQSNLFLGDTGTRTMFDIECYSARNIMEFSALKKENEVLLLPGFHFKVKAKLDAGNGLIIIQIEEIDTQPIMHKYLPSIDTKRKNEALEGTAVEPKSGKLDLKDINVKDQDMHVVIRKSFVENSIKILDLGCNEITHYGVTALAIALQKNKQLEELNLTLNQCSDLGVEILASVLNNTVLKRLDLSKNDITDEGARHLATMLESNTTLAELILNHNRITDAGLRPLIDVLTSGHASLQLLNLNANKGISDESIAPLKEMIKSNSSLKKLDLRFCGFSKQGEKELADEAKSNRKVKLWI